MTVLFLGSSESRLFQWLCTMEESVVCETEVLNSIPAVDFIVSYGYRHIIAPSIVKAFENRLVNLHISLLPWNRGADPNFWSWIENTPKGVTIHQIDYGLDTGAILIQEQVSDFTKQETLASSYEKLSLKIESLFVAHWSDIRTQKITPVAQSLEMGSYHRSADKEKLWSLLPNGWETPVTELSKYVL